MDVLCKGAGAELCTVAGVFGGSSPFCQPSGVQNFQMAPRFVENLWNPVLLLL